MVQAAFALRTYKLKLLCITAGLWAKVDGGWEGGPPVFTQHCTL